MTGKEFWDAVHADARVEWLGARADPDEVLIGAKDKLGRPMRFAVSLSGLADATWPDLLGVFLGERPASIMVQITRIVGYYSMLKNWNRSKLAELRDRQKGNYALDAEPTAAPTLRAVVRDWARDPLRPEEKQS
jgi:hypothetical protein